MDEPQRLFPAGKGTGAPQPGFVDLLLGEPPEGELDGSKYDEAFQGCGQILEALGWVRLREHKKNKTPC